MLYYEKCELSPSASPDELSCERIKKKKLFSHSTTRKLKLVEKEFKNEGFSYKAESLTVGTSLAAGKNLSQSVGKLLTKKS